MCGRSIPTGEIYYDIAFTREKENTNGSVEVSDTVSLFVCCTNCGDKDNTYHLFKKMCHEAGVA